MIKAMFLIRFRDDVPWPDVSRHWRTSHAQIALKVPGIQRYIQNHFTGPVDADLAAGGLGYQGIVECWYDDLKTFELSTTCDEWPTLRADEASVFQSHLFQGGFVEETVWRWEGLPDGPHHTTTAPA
jgi:hypothetical protein